MINLIFFGVSNLKELERPIFPLVEQIASTPEQFLSLRVSLIPINLVTHERSATNFFY